MLSPLLTLRTPTLIVQGTRDPFGSREEVAAYRLWRAVRVAWMDDSEHSFTPRKTSGRTEQQNWQAALEEIVAFLEALPHRRKGRARSRLGEGEKRRQLGVEARRRQRGGQREGARSNPSP
jgi:hypothetical protein